MAGVTLRNPRSGRVLEDVTNPDLIRYYHSEGWVEMTQAAAELVVEDGAGEFDPTAYTVEEVNTYLAGVDEAERDRVLAAERASDKPRKSLIGDE